MTRLIDTLGLQSREVRSLESLHRNVQRRTVVKVSPAQARAMLKAWDALTPAQREEAISKDPNLPAAMLAVRQLA